MSHRWIPIIATLAVMLIGHILSRVSISRYKRRYIETDQFRDKFIDLANYYMEHYQVNYGMYAECIQDANAMQAELGADGVIAVFSDPIKKMQGHDFQLLVNTLPDMKLFEGMLDSPSVRQRMQQLLSLCDDAMVKHCGELKRRIENEEKSLWNPFFCFASGIRWIVGLPADILYWMGIISERSNSAVHNSVVFKVFGHIITIVGLISSIMGIVLGWKEFAQIILNVVGKA